MKLLPFENINYKTKLSVEEIISRLQQITEPNNKLKFNKNNGVKKPYVGYVTDQNFSIKRIINYRNIFLPRIKGTITNDFMGVIIKVKMRLSIFAIIFFCFCFCTLTLVNTFFLTQSKSNPSFFLSFAMLLVWYVMILRSFKNESNIAKEDLEEIFKAEMIEA